MEPRKVAAAGVLLAWIGLLLPWERWHSLASSGDTDRGPAVFAVILALTTALVVFRFVRPVVCVLGVTLAAIALHAAIGSLTAGGLFVDIAPGAGVWVAALGAAIVVLAAASRVAIAVALGPIVAVALWPAQHAEIADDGASTLWWDAGTLYANVFGTSSISEIVDGEARPAVLLAGNVSPVRIQLEAVLVRGGALYVAVTDADRLIRITPDGERVVLVANTPRKGIARPEGPAIIRDGFTPRALAPAPDGGLYILSGNEVLRYRDGTLAVVTSQLFGPRDMAVDDDGRLYVADTGNGRVVRVARDGTRTTVLGTRAKPRCVQQGGDDPLPLDPRRCLGVDALAVGDDGTVYVATRGVASVLAFKDGRLRVVAGTGVRGPLGQVVALSAGPDGDLYVGETERVHRITNPATPRHTEPPAGAPAAAPARPDTCRALAHWSAATLRVAATGENDQDALRLRIPELERAARALDAAAPAALAEETRERVDEITDLREALERASYAFELLGTDHRGALRMIGISDGDTPLAAYGAQRCNLTGGGFALGREAGRHFCVAYQRAMDSTRSGSPQQGRAVAAAGSYLPPELRTREEGALFTIAMRVCAIR